MVLLIPHQGRKSFTVVYNIWFYTILACNFFNFRMLIFSYNMILKSSFKKKKSIFNLSYFCNWFWCFSLEMLMLLRGEIVRRV